MRTYKMLGGGTISATTNQELVLKLNGLSMFGKMATLREFMEETSRACKMYKCSEIRFDSFDNFINDLIENEFLIL